MKTKIIIATLVTMIFIMIMGNDRLAAWVLIMGIVALNLDLKGTR